MTKMTKWILAAAVLEMALVSALALLWKWNASDSIPSVAADHRLLVRQTVTLIALPVWVAAGWWLAVRRLSSRRLVPSAEHLRLFEISLVVASVVLVVMHGFMVRNLIAGDTIGREEMMRIITAFVGALTLVQGNFIAKVAPPSGVAAPDPHTWSRMMMRVGWGMALIGLAVMVCALTLPPRQLLFAMIAAVTALAANSIWQRRRAGISLRG